MEDLRGNDLSIVPALFPRTASMEEESFWPEVAFRFATVLRTRRADNRGPSRSKQAEWPSFLEDG